MNHRAHGIARTIVTSTLVLASIAASGCAATTEDGETFEETVVTFREGAAPLVVTSSKRSGLQPQSVTIASGCDSADLQLWDRAHFKGNTICFIGSGHADLTQYRIPPAPDCSPWISCYYAPWAGRVRSYRMAPLPEPIEQLAEPGAALFTDGTCQECVLAGTQRVARRCASSANAIDVIGVSTYLQGPPPACL